MVATIAGIAARPLAVKVSPICKRVSKIDPDAEADASIWRLISIVDRNLLLNFHGWRVRNTSLPAHPSHPAFRRPSSICS